MSTIVKSLKNFTPVKRKKYFALALTLAGVCCCGAAPAMADDTNLIIGDDGYDSYTNTDDTHGVEGNLILGNQAGGNGTYTITGDSAHTVVYFRAGGNGPADPPFSNGFSGWDDEGNPIGAYDAPNGALIIGNGGTGAFIQGDDYQSDTGNKVDVEGDLVLGSQASSQGQYMLNTGDLTVGGKLVVGGASQSDNLFTQNGGTVNITNSASGNPDYVGVGNSYHTGALFVGGGGDGIIDGGSGTYLMNGGVLTTNGIEVGHAGVGVMTQSGDSEVNTGYLWLGNASGYSGDGQYNLNDNGTLNVGNIAIAFGATGTLAMNGGTVNSSSVEVGVYNSGTFTQSAGDHNAHEVLLGTGGGGNGTYNLDGGTLTIGDGSTDRLVVGQDSQGEGTFTMTGGTLEIKNDDINTAAFVVGDKGGSVGTFTQSGGEVNGGRSLAIAANGGDGTYNLNTDEVNGTTPTLNTGFISLGFSGTGVFNQEFGTTNNTGALFIGADHGTYNQNGGDLVDGNTVVGTFGTGIFNQNGGTHTTESLSLGQHAGSSGTYTLNGGDLIVNGQMIVGHGNTDYSTGLNGLVQQDGGTVTANQIMIGGLVDYDYSNPGNPIVTSNLGTGRYELRGGTVTSNNDTIVGNTSQGRVVQTGGTFNAGRLTLGSSGLYSTSDGSGGYNYYSSGEYELSGAGILNTNGTTVAMFGLGTFNQSQTSQHNVTGNLVVGAGPGLMDGSGSGRYREGTYTLWSGDLKVTGDTIIGAGNKDFDDEPGGKGTFTQKAGNHTVDGNLIIGQEGDKGNGTGIYDLSGGALTVTNDILNNGYFYMEIANGAGSLTANTFTNNGNLEGTGTITASMVNNGAIFAGNYSGYTSGPSIGEIKVDGGLLLGELSTLFFDLGGTTQGTEYDYLHITGLATLGGDLQVELYDFGSSTFNPHIGDSFTILVADSGFVDGYDFSNYYLPDLADGMKWSVAKNNYDITLHVNAVPVPPAVFLLASGLASLFMVKRRKA